jgi:hypothetical protein
MVDRAAFAVIICLGLAGCGGFVSPQVITGGETTVSIQAGKWRNPISEAISYCAQYGRKAVEVSHGIFGYNKNSVLYVYDCVEKS